MVPLKSLKMIVFFILISTEYSVESCGTFSFQARHPKHRAFISVKAEAVIATESTIQETSTTSSITSTTSASDLLQETTSDSANELETSTLSSVTAFTSTILSSSTSKVS